MGKLPGPDNSFVWTFRRFCTQLLNINFRITYCDPNYACSRFDDRVEFGLNGCFSASFILFAAFQSVDDVAAEHGLECVVSSSFRSALLCLHLLLLILCSS